VTRPTYIEINADALQHNLAQIKHRCPQHKVIAMVKANAYGCGLTSVVRALAQKVDYFGVSCIEEALIVREITDGACILFEGVFSAHEWLLVESRRFECVIHHQIQLDWLLNTPLATPIRIWVKINTGMNRLGFMPEVLDEVFTRLMDCPWVVADIGVMTHLASADELDNTQNEQQLSAFHAIAFPPVVRLHSVANSAALYKELSRDDEVIRPGILLYGISPFKDQTGRDLHLQPVMRFYSAIIAIQTCPPGSRVGYGGSWQSQVTSRIGIVAVGYGDGYPRHIAEHTPTWINGAIAPIVGRVSMDMLTVDLTHCPEVKIGDQVELWGDNLPVEVIAQAAGTIAYELICQITPRARRINQSINGFKLSEENHEKM
jgi:alanine racemase